MDAAVSFEAILTLHTIPRSHNGAQSPRLTNVMDDESARQLFNSAFAERFHLRYRLSPSETVQEVIAVVRSTLRRVALSAMFRLRVHHLIRQLRLLMQWARQMRNKRNAIITDCFENMKVQMEERRHRFRQEIQTKSRVRSAGTGDARSKAVDGYVALQIPDDLQLAAVKDLYFQMCHEFWQEFRVKNKQLKVARKAVKDLERAVEHVQRLPHAMLRVEQLEEARKELSVARGEQLALELCLPKFRFTPTYGDCLRCVRRLMAEDPTWRQRRAARLRRPSSPEASPTSAVPKLRNAGTLLPNPTPGAGAGRFLTPRSEQPAFPRTSTALVGRRMSSSAPASPTSGVRVADLPDRLSANVPKVADRKAANAMSLSHSELLQRPFSAGPTVRAVPQGGGLLPSQVSRGRSPAGPSPAAKAPPPPPPPPAPSTAAAGPHLPGCPRPSSSPGGPAGRDPQCALHHLPLVSHSVAQRTKGFVSPASSNNCSPVKLRPLSSLRRPSHSSHTPTSAPRTLLCPTDFLGPGPGLAPGQPPCRPVWFGALGRSGRASSPDPSDVSPPLSP